jgi:uridine monophosphate synthetase
MTTPLTTPFFARLEARIAAVDSLLCIGLDPHVGQLTTPSAECAKQFCLAIIAATHEYAAAYKPNSAFFEVFGAEGIHALDEVIKAIPSDIPVILDVKRGDIDTTAQAYAEAALTAHGVGCVTLSPYMGLDSIKPFVTEKFADRAAFVLCKTSNPSSKVSAIALFYSMCNF